MSQHSYSSCWWACPPRRRACASASGAGSARSGAVPLKRSAYLLPDTPERYEDFQWLAQEIQREGGDATLIRVQQIENVSPDDVAAPVP